MAGNPLRAIPAVHEIVKAHPLTAWMRRVPRERIVATVRTVVDAHRQTLASGNGSPNGLTADQLACLVAQRLEEADATWLRPVINATGIILHTGLGRAPLAGRAVESLLIASQSYVPLEVDLEVGRRGDRLWGIRQVLGELTGAEASTVVNNNAAALVIALASLAQNRQVLVSRGELMEIGGGFRLPEIMEASGVKLVEVGTTNKTRLVDFDRAITDSTAAILKVHPSNFEQSGFVESVPLAPLAELAHRHRLPSIYDIGSGAIFDPTDFGLGNEPTARNSVKGGADLVLFSGDKLVGGPQAGIIVGRRQYVQQIERHPLMRAMRVDKLVLAALGATLQLHCDKETRIQQIPIWSMIAATVNDLMRRAGAIVRQLASADEVVAEAVESTAYVGGGAVPRQGIASAAVRLRPVSCSEGELARRLRTGSPKVVSRIQSGALILDLRAVFPATDDELVAAVLSAVGRPGDTQKTGSLI